LACAAASRLSDHSGPGFGDGAYPVRLKLLNFMLRLDAGHFVLGVGDLIGSSLDGLVVLFQLRLELGDFQSRQNLVCLNAGSVIDVEIFHVTGLFGIDLDFLERDQFG